MKTLKEQKSEIKLANGNSMFFNEDLQKWVANNYDYLHCTKVFKTKKAALNHIKG